MSYFNLTRPPVREYAGGSVGGILRKGGNSSGGTSANNGAYNSHASTSSTTALNAGEARQVDLLVFGYACKLFRDDDKARDIDHGKHMIPWMGDTTLKIDRYDVRGALSDLAPYEPPPGGYGNRLDYLSADEQRAEQLCEEERYLYLYNNEEDHILQQEEDLKRLKQDVEGGNYTQVDFQYGNDGGVPHVPNREEHSSSPCGEEAEQAFSLPKGFEVPINIQVPDTMKQHAIIEKTARFIASQGMQMEILLKAKQSNNVQFDFLAISGLLNPYYKYILNAIKNGSYPSERTPLAKESATESAAMCSKDAITGLGSPVPAKPIITVPTIKYKPSASCAYTQLISKIKGVPLPAVVDGELANLPSLSSSSLDSPTSITPVLLQYNGSTYVSAEPDEPGSNSNSYLKTNGNLKTEVEVLKNSSALALAQNYASDTESETDEEQPKTPPPPKIEPKLNIPVPTETLKNIIDKTATYVVKNGRQFEETLRSKSVDRFTFLLYDNEFYPYYLYKVTGDPDAASKEQKQRRAAAVAAALMSKKGLNTAEKGISPVCFSIKSNESVTTILQPVLPCEPSDDDEESSAKSTASARAVPEHVQKAIKMVESQLIARNAQIVATGGNRGTSNTAITAVPALHGAHATPNNHSHKPSGSRYDSSSIGSCQTTKQQLKSSKAEMERNALFEQQQQLRSKELRKAEEKVKDKLAKIAREKLGGPMSKEKQLQLERKRKAMAFLTHIKGSPSGKDSRTNSGKNSPNDTEKLNASDSEESVHSIPITSYGPDDDGKSDDEAKSLLIDIPKTHIAGATHSKTFTEPVKPKPATTVTVSDDDDVQLVGEIKPISRLTIHKQRTERKRQLRSRARDSSPDETATRSTKDSRKKRQRNRTPPRPTAADEDDDSGSSSDSTSATSTTSTATASATTYLSDDSTDADAATERRHRKQKSSAKIAKKSKKLKSSKSKKSASRSAHKKKSKKRARSRDSRSRADALYQDYKESEERRERRHKCKHTHERDAEYEHANRHSKRKSRNERSESVEARTERERGRERAHEREHEREREYRSERRSQREGKQREYERERERDRSKTPPRKEKRKKHDR